MPYHPDITVDEIIAEYKSRVASWPEISQFVRDVATDAKPASPRSAQTLVAFVAQFVDWAVKDGCSLDREVIFTPNLVERYIASLVGYTPGTVRTIRWALTYSGRMVTRRAPWPAPKKKVGRSPSSTPYSSLELRRLRTDLRNQSTDLNWRIGNVAVDLGLATGMRARELAEASADWLCDRFGVTGFKIPSRGTSNSRFVPIRYDLLDPILRYAERWPQGPLIHPGRVAFDVAVSRVRLSTTSPTIHAGRLRNTWLVWHLDHNTPWPALIKAAGNTGAMQISGIINFLAPRDEARDFDALFRGLS